MKFPKSKSEAEQTIVDLLKEITPHIEDSGKINIHINQVYISIYRDEDYARQSFIFFVLCKAHFFFPEHIKTEVLESIFFYIKGNYESNSALSELEKGYIEAYMVRAFIFWKKDSDPFLTWNVGACPT